MSRNILTVALVALASVFSLEAAEKKLGVEFTCGDYIALSDGSVWELDETRDLDVGQDVYVKGNYRKEWQKRVRSNKTTMKSYEMFLDVEKESSIVGKLIGISDLGRRDITSIVLPDYDLSLLEVFTSDQSEECSHLIELSDNSLFTSLSPEDGDCALWNESDRLVFVRFDLKHYFLLNLEKNSGAVALKLGTVKKEQKDSVVIEVSELKLGFEGLGRWSRVSDLPCFPWQLGEQVTVSYFDRMQSMTKPGDRIHLHNKACYALVRNHVSNEVVIVKQDYRRMPPEIISS